MFDNSERIHRIADALWEAAEDVQDEVIADDIKQSVSDIHLLAGEYSRILQMTEAEKIEYRRNKAKGYDN